MTREESDSRGGGIARLALQRPMTVRMAFMTVVVFGLLAWRAIPLELAPSGFTLPFLFVQVPTLRSAPADIEAQVAVPVEEHLATVRGIRRIGTRIETNNASFLLEFNDGTDMDLAWNQVRDRVERALRPVSDEVGRPFLWKYNPADDPVLWMAVSVEEQAGEVGPLFERIVQPQLERIEGVSRVDVIGLAQTSAVLRTEDRRLQAAGLDTARLIETLQRDNFAIAAGMLDAEDGRFPLRVVARWDSLADVRQLPLQGGLRLQDVADLGLESRLDQAVYRFNGQPGVLMAVYRESTANAVDVAAAVRARIEGPLAEDPRLEGVSFLVFFDQGEVILEALTNLGTSALWGGLFATLVLGLFLRRAGLTLLTALSIPVCLLLTVGVLYASGRTLNILSLTGMMLVVGMVVDNAIVVSESIQRRRGQGETPWRAAWLGTGDVTLAIVVSTMTTVVVFLPLMLMSGSETLAFYLAQIGFPVCVGLIASLVVSLVFLPPATVWGVGTDELEEPAWMAALVKPYRRMLRVALNRPADMVLLGALLVGTLAFPLSQVEETDNAQGSILDFRFWIDFEPTLSFEDQNELLLDVERRIWCAREELGVANLMVRHGGGGRTQVRAFLLPVQDRPLEHAEVLRRAQKLMPERPGVGYSLQWDQPAAASSLAMVRLEGADSERLLVLGEEAARRLRQVDGVVSVQVEGGGRPGEEAWFTTRSEAAARAGVSPIVAGTAVDFTLRGRRVSGLRQPDGELPLVVEGPRELGESLSRLGGLELPSPTGTQLLSSVTDIERRPGYSGIRRENRRTALTLTVHTSRDDIQSLAEDIDRVVEAMAFPPGYAVFKDGRFASLEEGAEDRRFALVLAIVFVFLLMGMLFESFLLPLAILFSVPFAFVGVYWMLWLTGTPFDTMAGVGMVLLVGIVVNNAVVLVDRASWLNREGLPLDAALIQAGGERLRPILMTALTTVFALIPMALGEGSIAGIPYYPLARAVIGGLIASTFLTLIWVPVFTLLLLRRPESASNAETVTRGDG